MSFFECQIKSWLSQLILERVDEMRKHPDVQRKFMEKIRSGKSEKECVEWVYMMAVCTLFGSPKTEEKK